MEITYRTKSTVSGMGIQVNSVTDESQKLQDLIAEMTSVGFRHEKSGVPEAFSKGKIESYFYMDGLGVFGFKNDEEVATFVLLSHPILKKYDKKFKKNRLYLYDND